jgi:hypothetical protein
MNMHAGAGRRPRLLACYSHATLPASLAGLACTLMGVGG